MFNSDGQEEIPENKWYTWQHKFFKEFLNKLNQPDGSRQIDYIIDPQTNTGKSTFIEWLSTTCWLMDPKIPYELRWLDLAIYTKTYLQKLDYTLEEKKEDLKRWLTDGVPLKTAANNNIDRKFYQENKADDEQKVVPVDSILNAIPFTCADGHDDLMFAINENTTGNFSRVNKFLINWPRGTLLKFNDKNHQHMELLKDGKFTKTKFHSGQTYIYTTVLWNFGNEHPKLKPNSKNRNRIFEIFPVKSTEINGREIIIDYDWKVLTVEENNEKHDLEFEQEKLNSKGTGNFIAVEKSVLEYKYKTLESLMSNLGFLHFKKLQEMEQSMKNFNDHLYDLRITLFNDYEKKTPADKVLSEVLKKLFNKQEYVVGTKLKGEENETKLKMDSEYQQCIEKITETKKRSCNHEEEDDLNGNPLKIRVIEKNPYAKLI
jgi:hypothetical protein